VRFHWLLPFFLSRGGLSLLYNIVSIGTKIVPLFEPKYCHQLENSYLLGEDNKPCLTGL